jgi:hypothetical protein
MARRPVQQPRIIRPVPPSERPQVRPDRSRNEPPGKPSRGQRFVALLLTLLFAAVVLALFVVVFGAAGHPAWGLIAGLLFCVLAGYGGYRGFRQRG